MIPNKSGPNETDSAAKQGDTVHHSEQEALRRADLEALRARGMQPYPARVEGHLSPIADLRKAYTAIVPPPDKQFWVAGRLLSRRLMGKASFVEIQDEAARLQLYLNRDELPEGVYNEVFKKHLSRGDLIAASGRLGKTQTGELTLFVKTLQVLAKALRPLPVVKRQTDNTGKETIYDAFEDPEQRYRQRYVDLTVNPEKKAIFKKRSAILTHMRAWLDNKGYLEVETPILQPIWGGAVARPFHTHHETLNMRLYLRIANELYLKRLIVAGFNAVYEIGKDFRNEGMSRFHNPEFTQMELYVAYMDYTGMMAITEQLIASIARALHGHTTCALWGHEIDFKAPWPRYRFYELLKTQTNTDLEGASVETLRRVAKQKGVALEEDVKSTGKILDKLFSALCEPALIEPCFVMDYPRAMSPLAKPFEKKPHIVERFEAFCGGREFANAYSELNDPEAQRARFEEQLKEAAHGDQEAIDRMDDDYLRALEYGMPPTAGLGIGIDRLTMLMTNQNSIQDVLFFPQMRPEKGTP